MALLGGTCFAYLILFSKRGIWELSMKSLAAISVSAPLAALIGLCLGILAVKRKKICKLFMANVKYFTIFTSFFLFNTVVIFVE